MTTLKYWWYICWAHSSVRLKTSNPWVQKMFFFKCMRWIYDVEIEENAIGDWTSSNSGAHLDTKSCCLCDKQTNRRECEMILILPFLEKLMLQTPCLLNLLNNLFKIHWFWDPFPKFHGLLNGATGVVSNIHKRIC